MLRVSKKCRRLVAVTAAGIDLTGYTIPDSGLLHIATCFPSLRALVVNEASHCADVHLEYLSRCRSLERVAFRYCNYISALGLGKLAAGCPNLREVTLWGSRHVDDEAVEALVTLCPGLHSLDLGRVVQITDRALTAIGRCCKALLSLNLYGCRRVTGAGLNELHTLPLNNLLLEFCYGIVDYDFSRLPLLRELHLDWCVNVSEAALRSIPNGCPLLKCLSVRGCTATNDETLEAFAKAPSLRTLNVAWCPLVTEPGLDYLRARHSIAEILTK